uniref:Phosphatidylinositol-specific phospholipase C X domain-containing protein n=1 Tax=Labrus bergylta TaxID=56723 RepID=A0A3Q3FR63_9LABR
FNDNKALDIRFYNQNWMKSIADTTPVSAITIPGTHDSSSLYGGPLIQCQVWTLEKQLNVGIRYFDMHAGLWLPSHKQMYARNSHWKLWKLIKFDEVLEIIFNFLDAHGSETVLLKVTLHGFLQKNVGKLMNQSIKKFENRIWTAWSVPNMQQARGKIVFLRSKTYPVGTLNHESFFFEHNKLENVEDKIKSIKSHLCNDYIVQTGKAAKTHRSPKTLAKKINKRLYDFVKHHKKSSSNQGCLGVLSMDFPGADVIKE